MNLAVGLLFLFWGVTFNVAKPPPPQKTVFNLLHNTLFIHDVCLEAQHSKHNQCGQNGGQKVDDRDEHGIKVAVVVNLIVTGEGNDSSKTQTEGKEDLGGGLPPHLRLQHLLQLRCEERLLLACMVEKTEVRNNDSSILTLGVNM